MRERIILAIDTSYKEEAEKLAKTARSAGAYFVKLGLELASATSWHYCSDLAARHDLAWVADAKLDDIPNTVVGAVKNISRLEHPPQGITMHTTAGLEAMRQAQKEAGVIKMLGVTVLTSLAYEEVVDIYRTTPTHKVQELARLAARASLLGVVASPQEVGMIKKSPGNKEAFRHDSRHALGDRPSRRSSPNDYAGGRHQSRRRFAGNWSPNYTGQKPRVGLRRFGSRTGSSLTNRPVVLIRVD